MKDKILNDIDTVPILFAGAAKINTNYTLYCTVCLSCHVSRACPLVVVKKKPFGAGLNGQRSGSNSIFSVYWHINCFHLGHSHGITKVSPSEVYRIWAMSPSTHCGGRFLLTRGALRDGSTTVPLGSVALSLWVWLMKYRFRFTTPRSATRLPRLK